MKNTMSGYFLTTAYAEDVLKISIADLKKTGFLIGFNKGVVGWETKLGENLGNIGLMVQARGEDGTMHLSYRQTDLDGIEEQLDYKINLTTTQCNYGGRRYWFICPLRTAYRPCGRRVGKLYLVGRYLGCRYCKGVRYKSRKYNKRSRFYVWDKSWNLERKLEESWMSLKRSYYAAKPTKAQIKLWQLEAELGYGSRVNFHGESIKL